MKSRMDKYYNDEADNNERSKKNETLYDTIYNLDPINNLSNINDTNEIDIRSLKRDTKSREDYHKVREYQGIINDQEMDTKNLSRFDYEQDDKVYDINSVLEKAKMSRTQSSEDEKYQRLRNTQYDILNKLNINETETINKELDKEKEKLQDLIDTITMSKKELEEIKKRDKATDLMADLMIEDEPSIMKTVPDISIEKEVVEINFSNKEEEHDDDDDDKEDETSNDNKNMDKSFYSNSFTFSKEDFEGVKNLESTVKTNNILIKVLLFILIVVITVVGLFFLNHYLDLHLFVK